ncbi:type II toxin-antitoxin system HicA family toxin [Algoriphagus persicinus]
MRSMRKLKVADVLKLLLKDDWFLHTQKGSHRQFKHLTKKGRVTVNLRAL